MPRLIPSTVSKPNDGSGNCRGNARLFSTVLEVSSERFSRTAGGSSRRRWAPCLAAFGLAWLACLSPGFAEATEKPRLQVGVESVGRLAPGTEFVRTVRWTNVLNRDFVVQSVSTSCECLQVLGYDRTTPSGGTLSVYCRLAPSGIQGFRFTVAVEGTSGLPALEASFDGEVVAEAQPGAGAAQADDRERMVEPGSMLTGLGQGQGQGQGPMWIDVRPRERFLLAHVPGSLNLPIHELRSHSALRRRELILLGDGLDSMDLLWQSGTWGRTGIGSASGSGSGSVRVLQGGLRGWQNSGGALEGTATNSARAWTLPAGDLLAVLARPEWLWIEPRSPGTPTNPVDLNIPAINRFPEEKLGADLRTRVQGMPAIQGIVLIHDDDSAYERWEHELSGQGLPPRLYLKGGRKALGETLASLDHRPTLRLLSGGGAREAAFPRSGGGTIQSSCCGRNR
jgi:hypothetical protein